jgi:hypothetical protein
VAASLGKDIKQVKDHFSKTDSRTAFNAVWGHQGAMNTIIMRGEHVGFGVPKKADASKRLYADGASELVIAERPHLSTEALLAMRSPARVLTTAFWEIGGLVEGYEEIVLGWLNSTYGILEFLGASTSSMGDIFKTKKDQLSHVRLPNHDEVEIDVVRSTLAAVQDLEFERFGAEWGRAATAGGPRFALDVMWAEQLGLPPIDAEHYLLLASDPVVTKRRL